MKRFKLLCPLLLMLINSNRLLYASEISTHINNTQTIPTTTYENQTFFPVRIINDLLGYQLSWDPETKSTTLQSPTTSVALSVNQNEIFVDEVPLTLSQAPKLINNVLYAPAEFWDKAFHLNLFTPNNEPTLTPPHTSENPPQEKFEKPIQQTFLPLFEGSNTYYIGQQLIIRLDENPSSGYIWQVNFPESLEVISNHFVPHNPELDNSPGEHSWVIKATKEGTYTIEFKKLRPSNPKSIIDTKVFKLKAKPYTPSHN